MTTTLKDKEKKNVVDFIPELSETARRKNWVSHYDSENDSFAIHAPKLSRDAEKKYINDEFAFYFGRHGEVEGVFIEYFMSNFIAHHKDFLEVKKDLRKQISRNGTIELPKRKTRKLAVELEGAIIDSLIPNRPVERTA